MESVAPPVNEALAEALRTRQPRIFRASRGAATGVTGHEDTARFAENLMVLQECAHLLGEALALHDVKSAVLYEGKEMAGFCFDPASNPQDPDAVGAMVNRRVAVREFLQSLQEKLAS